MYSNLIVIRNTMGDMQPETPVGCTWHCLLYCLFVCVTLIVLVPASLLPKRLSDFSLVRVFKDNGTRLSAVFIIMYCGDT